MRKMRIWALVLLLLAGLVGWFDYISEHSPEAWSYRPFRLGLDLQGGSHLVYEADTKTIPSGEVKDAMDALKEVIERRINVFGVSEPLIQVERSSLAGATDRLIVELPGVTDLKAAAEVIKATPLLEFKVERPEGPERTALIATLEKARADQAAGRSLAPEALALVDPYFVPTPLNGRHLKRAEISFTQNALTPAIAIEFNAEGSKLFAAVTKANVGKRVGIYLDGLPISSPVVREEIKNGRAEISGNFTLDEARTLVRNLNLGALPVPITLISTQTVGATLGGEALQRGIKAGLIGFLVVVLFMILWYRLPGLVASVSLSIYVILMLFIFKLLPVTLTAAGTAGFILSVGMAVDANVLIFERLKEELRQTNNLHEAINHGFARAWLSIRDSNLSTIISALILFWFGSSLIKGFALTLALGVVVSMLTAISITRTFLRATGATHVNRLTKFLFSCGLKF